MKLSGDMTQMKTSLIWKRLIIQDKKIVASDEIKNLAKELGKDGRRSLYYLQEEGYITRILRGIFYIKSIPEREQNTYDKSIYELVALALEKKGVTNWYFGLETALKMNNLTHEYFTIDYVLTDSYRTTKVIKIMDTRFQFLKRSKNYFKEGLIKKNFLRYSNPEKTVLDIAYQRYLNSKNPDLYTLPIKEYKQKIDFEKVKDFLSMYPPSFQKKMEKVL